MDGATVECMDDDMVDAGSCFKQQTSLRRMSETQLFGGEIFYLNNQLKKYNPQKHALQELDLYVLDNSLRETTVGQLRGHTLENKWKIYNEVKRVGFKDIIVESFNHLNRLGEPFIRDLISKGEDMNDKWAFTELFDNIDKNLIPIDDLPIGLKKMKDFGIMNVIMEMDLVYFGIDYTQFKAGDLCKLLSKRFKWIRENLSPDSRIFVNIRDFSECMIANPRRLLYIVHYISKLPENERIYGLAYEEGGKNYPEQLGVWTDVVRREMNKCGWDKGHLIIHVHQAFGMCDVVQLECLANGATGIWAGLCEEGAAMGHASSCLTIMNLIRMGNKKVLDKFNCTKLRSASRAVTEITTGSPPHAKQPVCGERALDVVFGLDHLTRDTQKEFSLPEFLGEKYEIRISNMTSPLMIVEKLESTFGEDPQFTIEIANKMQVKMLADLTDGVKEEYHSAPGLAMLFDRSGGKLNVNMMEVLQKQEILDAHQKHLIEEVREIWDTYDLRDGVMDDELDFDAFYDGFMAPHFGCYRCDYSRKALQCIDMDKDGKVDWNEFAVYLKWAAKQYPQTKDAYELISVAFNKGIKPAMHDEMLKVREDGEVTPASPKVETRSKFYTIQEYEEDDFLSEVPLPEYHEVDEEQELEFESLVVNDNDDVLSIPAEIYVCELCKQTKAAIMPTKAVVL